MSTLDATPRQTRADLRGHEFGQQAEGELTQARPQARRRANVGASERVVSVAAGSFLGLQGIGRMDLIGLLIGSVGGALIYRGVSGRCPMYSALGIDSARAQGDATEEEIGERGVQVAQAFLINRSPDELYAYWRNFANLPRIMSHLERVDVIDARRSHWVARVSRLAAGTVEWEAEVTDDQPDSRIAWRSLPGSDIDTTGEVRFARGLGDRGTEVHVSMGYVPPAGKLGHAIAKMLGQNPKRLIREDLRNFKRIMEIGEIPTISGQPRGTCTGRGMRSP